MNTLTIRRWLLFGILLLGGALVGCSSNSATVEYETVRGMPNRDTEAARKLNQEALKLIREQGYNEAEPKLKQALTADVTFGPAHNNLGKVYFHQERYYLAAWEFQYAIKLMPNRPEPRNNLGLVMEAVGKLDEAVQTYTEALHLQPDNPQLLGNLCRARVRRGDRDDQTRQLLSDLLLRETRPEWAAWAREKLVTIKLEEKEPKTIDP